VFRLRIGKKKGQEKGGKQFPPKRFFLFFHVSPFVDSFSQV